MPSTAAQAHDVIAPQDRRGGGEHECLTAESERQPWWWERRGRCELSVVASLDPRDDPAEPAAARRDIGLTTVAAAARAAATPSRQGFGVSAAGGGSGVPVPVGLSS